MSDICRGADFVLIWLGLPYRPDVAGTIMEDMTVSRGLWEYEYGTATDHTYWSRTWILQELVLSSRIVLRG